MASRPQRTDLDFENVGRILNLPDAAAAQQPATKAQLDLKAPIASPTFTGTVTVPDASFALAKLANLAGVSVPGRAANSSGVMAAITAAANDRLLRRVSDALDFGQLTAGMVPNAILTYAMLATAAVIGANEFTAATASKLLNAAGVWSDADYKTLTDGTNIAFDMATGFNRSVTLAGNRTLSNPSNTKNNQTGVVKLNASTSTRTLAIGTNYKPANGVESFPISIATTETVFLCYWTESSTAIWITAVLRRTT